ncbi:hypothetical protein COCMIDRAFT_110272, partial [Bipolaris oryzae ATCC 44560]
AFAAPERHRNGTRRVPGRPLFHLILSLGWVAVYRIYRIQRMYPILCSMP